MLSIIVSTPSGHFKAERLYLFLFKSSCVSVTLPAVLPEVQLMKRELDPRARLSGEANKSLVGTAAHESKLVLAQTKQSLGFTGHLVLDAPSSVAGNMIPQKTKSLKVGTCHSIVCYTLLPDIIFVRMCIFPS